MEGIDNGIQMVAKLNLWLGEAGGLRITNSGSSGRLNFPTGVGESTIILMDPEGRKFGRAGFVSSFMLFGDSLPYMAVFGIAIGTRELGGSIDLINHYKLEQFHEYFCKRALPSTISKSQYLQNVAGDREIRKGEGMELDQLVQNPASVGRRQEPLRPFQLDVLMDAFLLSGSTSLNLAPEKKMSSTGKSKLRKLKHKK